MNIYGDESGSINNKQVAENPHFVICLVRAIDSDKLKRVYKRFVATNIDALKSLDAKHSKMFKNGKFCELKGSCFDYPMKLKFIEFFAKSPLFELFYIVTDNAHLEDRICTNTARAFNYLICKALTCFRNRNLLPDEHCILQLDERNEKTETKYFLENYLNTELVLNGVFSNEFTVKYYDSSQNALIQVADVFSNIMFSQTVTGNYTQQIAALQNAGLLKFTFRFPLMP